MPTETRRLIKIGVVANIFEWYEFNIFIFLSALIGQLFFASSSENLALIKSFALFALSFIARPLGSLFFGFMGDRVGRRFSLKLSLILMAIPTILIGLLPSYEQVGIIATVALLILRLIQGFSSGGELPATACYIFDASNAQNRSLLCSLIVASPKIGMLLASFVATLLFYAFDHTTLLAWAWRIPFLLGIPLTLFIVYIRNTIHEIAPIKRNTASTIAPTRNWTDLIKPMVQAMCLVSFGAVYFYVVLVWMPFYLHHVLNASSAISYSINTLVLCMILPLYPIVGYFSRRWGYRNIMLISLLVSFAAVIPLFKGIQSYAFNGILVFLFQFGLAIIFVGIDGVMIEVIGNLFPITNRSLGFSLSWTLAATFAGGTTPLMCTYFTQQLGWLMFPGFYILAFGLLLALPAALRIKTSKAMDKEFYSL